MPKYLIGEVENLFWNNGSREKPLNIVTFKPSKSKSFILKIDWQNNTIGTVKLVENAIKWNYLIDSVNNSYYFLHKLKCYDVYKKLWSYTVIKDIWTSNLAFLGLVKGNLVNTNDVGLLTANLQHTIPLIEPLERHVYNSNSIKEIALEGNCTLTLLPEKDLDKWPKKFFNRVITGGAWSYFIYQLHQVFRDKILDFEQNDFKTKNFFGQYAWGKESLTTNKQIKNLHVLSGLKMTPIPNWKGLVYMHLHETFKDLKNIRLYKADPYKKGMIFSEFSTQHTYVLAHKKNITALGVGIEDYRYLKTLDLSKITDIVPLNKDGTEMNIKKHKRLVDRFFTPSEILQNIPWSYSANEHTTDYVTITEKMSHDGWWAATFNFHLEMDVFLSGFHGSALTKIYRTSNTTKYYKVKGSKKPIYDGAIEPYEVYYTSDWGGSLYSVETKNPSFWSIEYSGQGGSITYLDFFGKSIKRTLPINEGDFGFSPTTHSFFDQFNTINKNGRINYVAREFNRSVARENISNYVKTIGNNGGFIHEDQGAFFTVGGYPNLVVAPWAPSESRMNISDGWKPAYRFYKFIPETHLTFWTHDEKSMGLQTNTSSDNIWEVRENPLHLFQMLRRSIVDSGLATVNYDNPRSINLGSRLMWVDKNEFTLDNRGQFTLTTPTRPIMRETITSIKVPFVRYEYIKLERAKHLDYYAGTTTSEKYYPAGKYAAWVDSCIVDYYGSATHYTQTVQKYLDSQSQIEDESVLLYALTTASHEDNRHLGGTIESFQEDNDGIVTSTLEQAIFYKYKPPSYLNDNGYIVNSDDGPGTLGLRDILCASLYEDAFKNDLEEKYLINEYGLNYQTNTRASGLYIPWYMPEWGGTQSKEGKRTRAYDPLYFDLVGTDFYAIWWPQGGYHRDINESTCGIRHRGHYELVLKTSKKDNVTSLTEEDVEVLTTTNVFTAPKTLKDNISIYSLINQKNILAFESERIPLQTKINHKKNTDWVWEYLKVWAPDMTKKEIGGDVSLFDLHVLQMKGGYDYVESYVKISTRLAPSTKLDLLEVHKLALEQKQLDVGLSIERQKMEITIEQEKARLSHDNQWGLITTVATGVGIVAGLLLLIPTGGSSTPLIAASMAAKGLSVAGGVIATGAQLGSQIDKREIATKQSQQNELQTLLALDSKWVQTGQSHLLAMQNAFRRKDLGPVSDREVSRVLEKIFGHTILHIDTYLPNEKQEFWIKRHIREFGCDLILPGYELKIEEMKSGSLYRFSDVYNLTIPNLIEREYIRLLFINGVKFKEVI